MIAERGFQCREVRSSESNSSAGSITRAVRGARPSRRERISGCCCWLLRGHRFGAGMAWRAADSLSYRKFLGYDLSEQTPDHSTVSRPGVVLGGDAPGGDEVGVKILAQAWVGRCAERVHRRDYVAG